MHITLVINVIPLLLRQTEMALLSCLLNSNVEMPKPAQSRNWNKFDHSEPRLYNLDTSSACIDLEVCTEK